MPSEKTIQRYLAKAREVSLQSTFPQHKLGAVLVVGKSIIATGYNSKKTYPMQKEFNQYRGFRKDTKNNGAIHAEMQILQKTKYLDIDWSKVSLYIYREHKDGTPALAKPCKACEAAIKKRGIKHVYYTIEGYNFEKLNENKEENNNE